MLKIKTWRDPYDAGFSITRPKEIIIKDGLTVLVGCNGAGKTTLLQNIKEQCKAENIPHLYYNNLSDGGSRAFEASLFHHNLGLANSLYNSSEGEAIKINFGNMIAKIKDFIKTGSYDTVRNRYFQNEKEEKETDNRRLLLFDAIDSGLSVDTVAEVRDLFDIIQKDMKDVDVEMYIIITANTYELARKAPCFDVAAGKYVEFSDYESYRTFIMQSRKRKEKRNQTGEKALKRRAAKEQIKDIKEQDEDPAENQIDITVKF